MRSLLLKRIFDLTTVIFMAPMWLPLLAIIALLVWRKLGAPVFFRQRRPGYQEKIFEMIKFRTMRDERDGQGRLLADSDRLTPFGRWLRSTSLDELPELLNVLQGEMSLVGPRPLLVEYLGRYSSAQRRRHEVFPGLTGWTQINGRNALSWEEKFALDLYYVDHGGFGLDLQILFRTVWQVITRRGISAPGDATMPEFHATQFSNENSSGRDKGTS